VLAPGRDPRSYPAMRCLPALALLAALALPARAAGLLEGAALADPPANAAIMLVERGELDEAERRFEALRLQSPFAVAPRLGLAEVAARRGDAAEAQRRLEAAIEAIPQSTELLRALGRLHAQRGEAAPMEAAFRRAIALRPAEAANALELADLLHLRFGRPADAVPLYEAAAAAAPGDWRAPYGRGVALARAGRAAEAIAPLEQAARLDARTPLPDHARGQVLQGLGRLPEALEASRAALLRQPDWAPGLGAQGAMLLAARRPREALGSLGRAAALQPEAPGPRAGMALAHEALGEGAAAERLWREVLALEPAHGLALNNLAWLLAVEGRALEEARGLAERAVAAAPGNPAPLATLGWVERGRGDLPAAERALRAAVAAQPTAERLTRLAMVHAAMGRRDEAAEGLRRALALDPAHALARAEQRRLAAR